MSETATKTERLPTGIDILDDELNGGLYPGSVVVLSAPPASQAERFLARLTGTRNTLYLTTQRSASAVETTLERSRVDPPTVAVREVNAADPLGHATRLSRELRDSMNLVVDAMNPLETASDPKLWAFLNAVRESAVETGSVAVLHCATGRRVPDARDTTEYMADVVFELRTDVHGDSIENRLHVPKVRGGRALDTVIKLDLSQGVSVDTSRDIA